ncbi:MAG: RluA family pseudouridine synthase [Spirochaetes bacterium]|nr:RluA family pseudouridine synthase [Spirochaetota bacterium]
MIPLLYEDDDILVIDKPAGLPAQPGEGVSSSVVSVIERDLGFSPFLVHRLDKETAGCMVLTRNSASAARFSALLRDRGVTKIYKAICSGKPQNARGTYQDPISLSGRIQEASTSYRLIAAFGASDAWPGGFSFIEFELGTGRTHQIRRHCALHAHPILGDDKYGDFVLNRGLKKAVGLKNLLLWSCELVAPGLPRLRSSIPPHFLSFLGKFDDAPAAEEG